MTMEDLSEQLPYEINYSSGAYKRRQYQSEYHARIDRVKDCFVWAWILEHGTGFEPYELTDNTDGSLLSYYCLSHHQNYIDGIENKATAYEVPLLPETFIRVITEGYLYKVRQMRDKFWHYANLGKVSHYNVWELALKFDYINQTFKVIYIGDISYLIPF